MSKKISDLKAPTAGEVCRALEKEGWEFDHQEGSHRHYVYENGVEVIVADHGGSGRTIPKGTWCAMKRAILVAMGTLIVVLALIPIALYV